MGDDSSTTPTIRSQSNRVERAIGAFVRKRLWARSILRYGVPAGAVVTAFTKFLMVPEPWNSWALGTIAVLTALFAIVGVAAAIDTANELKSSEEYINQGYLTGLRRWREQTNLRAGGMRKLLRRLNTLFHEADLGGTGSSAVDANATEGEEVIRTFLGAISNTVVLKFALDSNDVKVNLMVPVQSNRRTCKLTCVAFAVEDSNRTTTRELVIGRAPRAGAITAFEDAQPQYIPDTHDVPDMEHDRPYRSIVSWPIENGHGDVILGVVNIDCVSDRAFGDESPQGVDDREAARLLCSDLLFGLGIALLDKKCFSCGGKRVREAR